MGVTEFLCDRRFHRTFVLPPNPDNDRPQPYRVSYADFGDPDSNAVVLLCGGLMGARLCYSHLDQLAKTHRVRIIHPDRPGIGGSDAVDLGKRVQTWLEIVPRLLSHLGILHVSLASHSCGDIYLMNTILTYPHLMHPERPYVCFFAPWVHPTRSRLTHLRATELLSSSMIAKYASLAKFVNDNVFPLVGHSSDLISGIRGSMSRSISAPATSHSTNATTHSRDSSTGSYEDPQDLNLEDPHVVEEVQKLATSFKFAECMDGISADAQFLLKRGVQWHSPSMEWTDFDYGVQLLSKVIREDDRLIGSNRNWTVDCFHAAVDDMIGEKGRQWFDDCWVESPSYNYRTEIVKDTDHDFLMDPAFGASEIWLKRVSEAWQPSEPDATST